MTDVKKAIDILWERGDIAQLLMHSSQMDMYSQFKNSTVMKFVLNCARRWGKSWGLLVIADETARKVPNAQIMYAAATGKAVRKIIRPILKKIWKTCPENLKPQWKTAEQCYVYPNGSELHVAGTDQGNSENLRGTHSDLAIVDEAGFVDELHYLIQDILLPQTMICNGRILIASTPPRTPGHEYVDFYLEAVARGACSEKTIYDNPLVDEDKITEYMAESGGEDSTTWQREYLAKFVTDLETQILPEFRGEVVDIIAQAVKRPEFYDSYVSMDVGFEDLTFLLLGYWDYTNDRLVIEDEIVLQGATEVRTDYIASYTKNMELDLWGEKSPYLRVSDQNPILLNDLSGSYGINFQVTDKDEKEAAINEVRLLITQDKLRIHPRCTSLLAHCKYGVWDKRRKKFQRTRAYGHFDGVDSLVYMVRNLRKEKNPYPQPQHSAYTEWFNPDLNSTLGHNAKTLQEMFKKMTKMFNRR